jgi:hypothetical protein
MVLATRATGEQILKTSGFTTCAEDSTIVVDRIDISYNNDNKTVIFDISGASKAEQNVSAFLDVTAYGQDIYQRTFNPCDDSTFVAQLCPLPEGPFSARGIQQIPSEFADLVPDIAFQIPDIAAQARLELRTDDTNDTVACIQSQVNNGKTANVPAVSYVAAGVAGGALVVSGASAAGSILAGGSSAAGVGGTGTPSPSFVEVMTWFQGLAMNGMLSVNYPPIYRSFTKNFAFSTGLIPWEPLQRGIDSFRGSTGGNLSRDSVDILQNATLLFPDGSTNTADHARRALSAWTGLAARQLSFPDATADAATSGNSSSGDTEFTRTVSGIQAYAEQLRVPKSDVFMTVLLAIAIAIAATALGILLFKLVLELWALCGSFPASLAGFREHYWGSLARAITSLILILYGIWVLYCVFQFTHGDSWAATLLAAVTLAIFTGVLGFFAWKICRTAARLRARDGDAGALFDEKDVWVKYSLFYDAYRRQYWWVFVPVIVYMAVKGCVLAAADGSGRAQTIAVLAVETVMLGLLVWGRPYERKSGNILNIVIQVVRVLSVACILVFVEEFGIQQSTQSVTGVVLIALQSALTVALVILIIWNAFNACCKENPHRKRRKELSMQSMYSPASLPPFSCLLTFSQEHEANRTPLLLPSERLTHETDDLTPLDARNSLLLERPGSGAKGSVFSITSSVYHDEKARNYMPERYMVTSGHYDDQQPLVEPAMSSLPVESSSFRALTPAGPLNQPTDSHGYGPGYGYGQSEYGDNRGRGSGGYPGQPTYGGYRGF